MATKKKLVIKKKKKGVVRKTVLKEKKALVMLKVGPKNTSKEVVLGYTEFPADVPTSNVVVKPGMTRNIAGFDYIRVDVELSDVTLANPKARAACADALIEEALEITVKAAKAAAKKLFNTTL